MQDIVTIGSSLIDIFITSEYFQIQHGTDGNKLCQLYGEKLEVDSFDLRTGGGASNTAVGFARAGFTVATITEIGRDTYADAIIKELHEEYVSTSYVIQEKKEQTGGSVILVGPDGGRTVMVHRGASSLLDAGDIPAGPIEQSRWVHLSSIAGRRDTLKIIGKRIQQNGKNLSWNPGRGELQLLQSGELQLDELPSKILFVNDSEWQSISSLHNQVRQTVGEVIITNGSAPGKIYLGPDDSDMIEFQPPQSRAVDETGAGDAFAVGYVSGRLAGKEPSEAISWGLRNAQSVIKYFGAKPGLLTQPELAGV